MLLSQLHEVWDHAPSDAYDYVVYLATVDLKPDDDVDVQLVEIGDIRFDYDNRQICLIPASSTDAKPVPGTFTLLGSVMEACPRSPDGEPDLKLVVEMPLLREDPRFDRLEWTEMAGVHLGPQSQEAWFLVQPASRFAPDSLPV